MKYEFIISGDNDVICDITGRTACFAKRYLTAIHQETDSICTMCKSAKEQGVSITELFPCDRASCKYGGIDSDGSLD